MTYNYYKFNHIQNDEYTIYMNSKIKYLKRFNKKYVYRNFLSKSQYGFVQNTNAIQTQVSHLVTRTNHKALCV